MRVVPRPMRCDHDRCPAKRLIREIPNGLVQATPGAAWEFELKICISLLFAKGAVGRLLFPPKIL